MQVTNYQMHAMLECYSKKLIHAKKSQKPENGQRAGITQEQALSAESTREATMARISRQVLDKVTDVVALSISQGKTLSQQPEPETGSTGQRETPAEEFTYNVIDAINRKRTDRLVLGDSGALYRRLERMAEKAATNTTKVWV
jgi:hypothetical protein